MLDQPPARHLIEDSTIRLKSERIEPLQEPVDVRLPVDEVLDVEDLGGVETV